MKGCLRHDNGADLKDWPAQVIAPLKTAAQTEHPGGVVLGRREVQLLALVLVDLCTLGQVIQPLWANLLICKIGNLEQKL